MFNTTGGRLENTTDGSFGSLKIKQYKIFGEKYKATKKKQREKLKRNMGQVKSS